MLTLAAAALAGNVYVLDEDPEGVSFRSVSPTGPDDAGALVTWARRPVELVVVADLSGSIVADEHGAAWDVVDALLTLHAALRARGVPGDRLGVTVFAGGADPWIPLGSLYRPGLVDWLAAFGPPRDYGSLASVAAPAECRALLRGREWTAIPGLPARCALREDLGTDAAAGIALALDQLGPRSERTLRVILVLWDGEQTVDSPLRRVLDRAWAEEVHVWSIGLGGVVPSGLVARGAGDAYLANGRADLVVRRIVGQLGLER